MHLYDVRAQEAALAYQRTVLNALHEVENAIAAYGADQQRRVALDATVAQNRDALALSRQRYEAGVVELSSTSLDVERTLAAERARARRRTHRGRHRSGAIYRALGGAWG